jgi:hypothetical protein
MVRQLTGEQGKFLRLSREDLKAETESEIVAVGSEITNQLP